MLVPLGSVLTVPDVTTHDASGGAAPADRVTFAVLGAADTPVVEALMNERAGMPGVYSAAFPLEADDGFAIGQTYSIVSTATMGALTAHRTLLYFRVGPPEASPGVVAANAVLVANKPPEDVASLTTAMFTRDTGKTFNDAVDRSVVREIADAAL